MLAVLKQRAAEEGIHRFSAVMSPANEASHRMMQRMGRVLRDEYVDGTREIEVDLDAEPAERPARLEPA
jgi:RimJ/RimL family protein N-acetyltransferase